MELNLFDVLEKKTEELKGLIRKNTDAHIDVSKKGHKKNHITLIVIFMIELVILIVYSSVK